MASIDFTLTEEFRITRDSAAHLSPDAASERSEEWRDGETGSAMATKASSLQP